MNSLLNGLKIIDFSTLLPGPFATLYLADMGAEVLHIESEKHPDLVRALHPQDANGHSYIAQYLGRNKQSIALDLKDPAQREQIYQKISQMDILVEQFRPGVMQRLGLGYEELSQINPKLIYCSITGYGQTGVYRDRAGHDLNYMALSGIAGHSGRNAQSPPPLGIQVADVAGGSMHAVIAILAAVIERQKSGLGQHIDIAMTDCAMSLNNMAAIAALNAVPQQPEQGTLNGGSFYDYYATLDGRFLAIAGLEAKFIQTLAEVLQLPDLYAQLLSPQQSLQQQGKADIAAKIKSKTWAEWRTLFADTDACVEPVLSLSEALASPLAQERSWVVNVPHPSAQSTVPQLACPLKFSRSQLRYDFVGQALGAGKWPEE